MNRATFPNFIALLLLLPACASSNTAGPTQPGSDAKSPPKSNTNAAASAAPDHVCPCKLHLPPEKPRTSAGKPCSPATNLTQPNACLSFDDAQQALSEVTRLQPQILAIGETHALAAKQDLQSTTARFSQELLPKLTDFHAMILEALIPASGCAAEKETVRKQTQEVTKPQAKENPNEFLKLAEQAKESGITPYPLRLSCDDLKGIAAAGDQGVEQTLRLIGVKTTERAHVLLDQKQAPFLIYGGAMHNDVEPAPGREAWSFGPTLIQTQAPPNTQSYIELDLITREFIADRAPWNELPWYATYVQNCTTEGTLLIRQGEHSYTLIFPWQESGGHQCPPPATSP